MAKRDEIRGGWKEVAMGSVAGWFAQSLAMTLKVDVEFECEGPLTSEPVLFCLWHNRILGAAPASRHWLKFRSAVALTSASKDGTIIATAIGHFDFGAVQGSSSRRGARALVALKKALQKGQHVLITSDGPKGPRYQLQPGIVKLASLTGTPIIPFHVDFEKSWRIESWDRLHIPKPFSRVRVVFGEEFVIPKGLDKEGFERERKRVEKAMSRRLNGVR
jgi:lysophospholipid acyltransferase (LPLAT)-like uncharacterized protein